MDLTNRELSILAWVTVFLLFASWKTRPWKLLRDLISVLISRPILIVLAAMAIQVAASVWVLWVAGFWELANIKTTLLWVATFAISTLFRLSANKVEGDLFKEIWRDIISLNIFVVFLADTYTFSLPVELILVPFASVVGAMSVYTAKDEKHSAVRKVLDTLLFIIGLMVLINAIRGAAEDAGGLFSVATAREFAVPIVLSVLYLPFLFVMQAVFFYEANFVRVDIAVQDRSLRWRSRIAALCGFKFDLEGVVQWGAHIGRFPPENVSTLRQSIEDIKRQRRRQLKPFRVVPEAGWLPERAAAFLEDKGLGVGRYHRTIGGWTASSVALRCGEGGYLASNLFYCFDGDEWVVHTLTLILNVNDKEEVDSAEVFEDMSRTLINRSLFPFDGKGRTIQLKAGDEPLVIGRISFQLTKDEYAGDRGYRASLKIRSILVPELNPVESS